MKMISLRSIFLSLFFTSAISEYILNQIDGINGLTRAVEFDSDGNAYIAVSSNGASHQLYKLNSQKKSSGPSIQQTQ